MPVEAERVGGHPRTIPAHPQTRPRPTSSDNAHPAGGPPVDSRDDTKESLVSADSEVNNAGSRRRVCVRDGHRDLSS